MTRYLIAAILFAALIATCVDSPTPIVRDAVTDRAALLASI